jgi:hypothetical protein
MHAEMISLSYENKFMFTAKLKLQLQVQATAQAIGKIVH